MGLITGNGHGSNGNGSLRRPAAPLPAGRERAAGDVDPLYIRLQAWLAARGFFRGEYAPRLGPKTQEALRKWQQRRGLTATGLLDVDTQRALALEGFDFAGGGAGMGTSAPNGSAATAGATSHLPWAAPPDLDGDGQPDVAYLSDAARFALAESPTWTVGPDGVSVRMDPAWEARCIASVAIPQLKGVPLSFAVGASSGKLRLHRVAAPAFQAAFADIEAAGLLPRVVDYGGAYNPRFIRGSTTQLSNHALGFAIDINVAANPLGSPPAAVGKPGSVLELVPIFVRHRIYWGGWYRRPDGMHFEYVGGKR